MKRCPACQQGIPNDAKFCGFCGFRLGPIARSERPAAVVAAAHGAAVTTAADPRVAGPPAVAQSPAGPGPEAAASKPQLRILGPADEVPAAHEPPGQPSGSGGNGGRQQTDDSNAAGMMAAESDPRRRQYQRFPLRVEVNYRSVHNFFTGFTHNISGGGLFVGTYSPSELGEQVEVTFTVPGLNEACVARCEVVWVREHDAMSPDMVPGMGLRFVELNEEASEAIGLFIQHREPIFFEE